MHVEVLNMIMIVAEIPRCHSRLTSSFSVVVYVECSFQERLRDRLGERLALLLPPPL